MKGGFTPDEDDRSPNDPRNAALPHESIES